VTDNDGLLFGIITLQDLARARENGTLDNCTTGEICTRDVLTVQADEPVSKALALIGERDLGRLPIVALDNPRRIVGVLRRRDIARAYDMALQRKLESQHRAGQVRLAAYSHAHVNELRVEPASPADGTLLGDLAWPRGSVVASIWRQGQVIIPRGDTRLKAGDLLTIVTTQAQEPELTRIVATSSTRSVISE
jgi:CIC family chloride channel protein